MNMEIPDRDWKLYGGSLALLLLVIAVAYHHSIGYLLQEWSQIYGDYGHGYLVLLISLGLVFHARKQLAGMTPRPDYRVLPAVGLASILWMLASVVDVEVVQVVSVLLVILFVIWSQLGRQPARQLAFPLLFLIFAIPVWFPLSPPLQQITADSVFWLIRRMNVPAFRQEHMIILPAGRISIEEACSGLRFLLAALTLGVLYAYLNYRSWSHRLMVIAVSAAAAVLLNIVRVLIVVYLAYRTDMHHPFVKDHFTLGWILFGVMVVFLLFIDIRLHRPSADTGREEGAGSTSGPAATGTPSGSGRSPVVFIMAATIMVLAGPAGAYWIQDQASHGRKSPQGVELPTHVGGWTLQADSQDDWVPAFRGAETQKKAYRRDTEIAHIFVGYYQVQSQGNELISDINSISGATAWRAISLNENVYSVNGYTYREQLLENGSGARRLVWYWYNVGGRTTTNRYFAKLLQIPAVIFGGQGSYVVAIAMDRINDDSETRSALKSLVSKLRIKTD